MWSYLGSEANKSIHNLYLKSAKKMTLKVSVPLYFFSGWLRRSGGQLLPVPGSPLQFSDAICRDVFGVDIRLCYS